MAEEDGDDFLFVVVVVFGANACVVALIEERAADITVTMTTNFVTRGENIIIVLLNQ